MKSSNDLVSVLPTQSSIPVMRPRSVLKPVPPTRHVDSKLRPTQSRTHTWRFESPSKAVVCLSAQRSVLDVSEVATPLSIELSTQDVQNSIQFDTIPLNGGKTRAIVISSVRPDSASAAAGIRPGMRLLQLSDPIQPNQVWSLNDQASLRYVKDAVRMQRAGTIYLTVQSLEGPGIDVPRAAGALQEPTSGGDGYESTDVLDALVGGVAEESRETRESAGTKSSRTIGDRLERQVSTPTALQRRIARRKEYMSKVNERNDAPLFLGLVSLFVLPALIILAVVSMNGYLDYLNQTWSR